jgi:hypothetical protein
MTEDYLARAKRGNRKAYDAALRKVRDVPAQERGTLSHKRMKLARPGKGR